MMMEKPEATGYKILKLYPKSWMYVAEVDFESPSVFSPQSLYVHSLNFLNDVPTAIQLVTSHGLSRIFPAQAIPFICNGLTAEYQVALAQDAILGQKTYKDIGRAFASDGAVRLTDIY